MRLRDNQYAVPLLFVLLWSTGFTVSKLGLPYAEPLSFLSLRFSLAAFILVLVIAVLRAGLLKPQQYFHCAVVGILIHAIYLGGVFSAIDRGVDAGIAALIVCLQPVLTIVLAALFLREPLTRRKLIGTALGFTGAVIVLLQRGIGVSGIDLVGVMLCLAALFGISIGTLYQKRFVVDVSYIPSVCTQYIAATLVLLPFAMTWETLQFDWTPTFIFSLGWLVFALSLGAVFLLMLMIRRGEVSRVASYIYLVPPFVVVEAYFLFGETLSAIALCGIALCVLGVAMVTREQPVGKKPDASATATAD
ncbi:MAG: DMT family transporter [Granulosicoccus sp.]